MGLFSSKELERLERAAALLFEAEDRLPVLRTISWDRAHATQFFDSGEKELPRPVYSRIDPAPSCQLTAEARNLIEGDTPVHDWLTRLADTVDTTAAMLGTVGTPAFYDYSKELYGAPDTPIADGKRTALDFATTLDEVLSEFDEGSLRLGPPERLTAEELKAELDEALPVHFGHRAPRVLVTSDVSAKAAAGSDYIKLREDAVFSDLDASQLLQHEALIHIATGMNGRAQPHFPILAESHPGNARTQEGLAVFAELISGAIDPRRLKRLADRTIAIGMAAEGADFIELYNFFRERNDKDAPFEAFESARRVVRGGMVEGGAPFTKDSVYLGGLIEIHTYLRAAIRAGDASLIRLLFIGKLDLRDLDAAALLLSEGLLSEPLVLPPWAKDLRFLLSYLSYSTFLNQIDQSRAAERFEDLIDGASMNGSETGQQGALSFFQKLLPGKSR